MPKNIENALNEARKLRLKIESANPNDIYAAIREYEQKHAFAYMLLKKWVRCV